MNHDTAASAGDAPAGPVQALLAALAQCYGESPFSARAAATAIAAELWQAAGVDRPDAATAGRWLRARRGPGLTGRPDRTGVCQWRVRGATGSSAALQAPVPAPHAPAPPLAQQPAQRDPAPPAPPAFGDGDQMVQQPAPQPPPPPAQQAPQQPW